jgi:hypothetical protein
VDIQRFLALIFASKEPNDILRIPDIDQHDDARSSRRGDEAAYQRCNGFFFFSTRWTGGLLLDAMFEVDRMSISSRAVTYPPNFEIKRSRNATIDEDVRGLSYIMSNC